MNHDFSMQKKSVPDAANRLFDLIIGSWASQIIYTSAKAGIVDKIQTGFNSPEKLASILSVNKPELNRLLSAVETLGLIRLHDTDLIELTEMGELLRSDTDETLHPFALLCGQDWHSTTWEHLFARLGSNKPAFDEVMGEPVFEYLTKNLGAGALFDNAMNALSSLWGPYVVSELDLSELHSILDIGGGSGIFLAQILKHQPHLRGHLLDLPDAVDRARRSKHLSHFSSAQRCDFIKGSFFEPIPVKADAHIMKFILHDWADHDALTILLNSHRALNPGGRLFVIEQVISATSPPLARLSDIEMMLFGTGKERTVQEFTKLLEQAAFKVENIKATTTPFSIIEASAL
ncbi:MULTISPECIES: methyltransferase [Pseudomonas]|uniref:Methyltransferase n=1 Tax=Pseudomonas aphyarum TaxID=2942629 RepID=A0ABT5PGH8_9PSED|nr:methyltransferase [Pseudomonas aphyarum]MDD0970173.1 methyltransferase [Pseudomonas aphyarum]MDD1122994.1 methyltransferase [Pseudomonas aphyarum]